MAPKRAIANLYSSKYYHRGKKLKPAKKDNIYLVAFL